MEQSRQKAVAIVQSNYVPWKGYFDLIRQVDEFVLLDDVQFTRRDWRNRNKIKTPSGVKWITIPVDVKGKYYQLIKDTQISDPDWNRQHYEIIQTNYARAPYFKDYAPIFKSLYMNCKFQLLSEINRYFLEAICEILGITTKISWSSNYMLADGKNERLISLCKQAGGVRYISGPAAQDYLDTSAFAAEGITVEYVDYSGYPEYPQLFPPFEHGVSIVDLIFNVGPNAIQYMKQF